MKGCAAYERSITRKDISQGMTAGGKRPGAGRKRREIPRVSLTIRVEREVAARFKAVCKATGKSQSATLERLLASIDGEGSGR